VNVAPGCSKRLDWCFRYFPNLQVYFYVVNKSTGAVSPTVYASEPFFFFHVINAFQENDQYICLDIMTYKDAEVGGGKIKINFQIL
jgi:carotenoid cleavage dioxygenase-like enzyme